MTILARKPKIVDRAETVLVDRGPAGDGCRYVVATATPKSLANGEWFWGSYYRDFHRAMDDFNSRPTSGVPTP